jgi:hypothetical protein
MTPRGLWPEPQELINLSCNASQVSSAQLLSGIPCLQGLAVKKTNLGGLAKIAVNSIFLEIGQVNPHVNAHGRGDLYVST